MQRAIDVAAQEADGAIYDYEQAKEEGLFESLAVTYEDRGDPANHATPVKITDEQMTQLIEMFDFGTGDAVETGQLQHVVVRLEYFFDYGEPTIEEEPEDAEEPSPA